MFCKDEIITTYKVNIIHTSSIQIRVRHTESKLHVAVRHISSSIHPTLRRTNFHCTYMALPGLLIGRPTCLFGIPKVHLHTFSTYQELNSYACVFDVTKVQFTYLFDIPKSSTILVRFTGSSLNS